MKLRGIIVLAVCLSVGAAFAEESEEQTAEDRWGHLEKGKSGFRETWVKHDTDFSQYKNLYLWNAEFQYRDVGPARRTRTTMMNTRQREYGISDEGRQEFEETVSEVFVAEINKGKRFTVVEEIGPDTLIMRAAVLDIISKVPPQTVGRSEIFLSTIGEATLVLELIDAESGEVVAVVSERQRIQSGSGNIDSFSMPTNRATVLAEIRRWARRAAGKLRKELDKAMGG
jgi:hypothetical protein